MMMLQAKNFTGKQMKLTNISTMTIILGQSFIADKVFKRLKNLEVFAHFGKDPLPDRGKEARRDPTSTLHKVAYKCYFNKSSHFNAVEVSSFLSTQI